MYFLKLSGHIPPQKQIEFEQTYSFASIHISRACIEYHLSKDVMKEGVYYFLSYWLLLPELESYIHSASFLMITGAFKTLGEVHENVMGKMLSMEESQIINTITINQIN